MFIILETSSVEKLTVSSDLLVGFARLLGKALLLFNRVHWFPKKVLKFVINLFSSNTGGIQGIFLIIQKGF